MPQRLIGRTLGRYRIDALLGVGGFAWVYLAYDPDLKVEVALKVLKPQFAGDPDFEERFRREASTAARLRHPNIIKIYTVGREDDAVYFAMDLYNQTLPKRLEVMGVLPEPALIHLGLDVTRALGFAHRQGVIHRDIKADNILFDDHGNAVVADFGIARASSVDGSLTSTNMIVGTPQYFAPEQARGQPLDARVDIYALGVTLFLAGTGQLPFTGDDWYTIAKKHLEEAPPHPRSINPVMSEEMEAVILCCLEKDRAHRYASAENLQNDLAAISGSRAGDNGATTVMIATPASGRQRSVAAAAKPSLWRRAIAAMFLILFAFGGAAGIFIAVELTSEPRTTPIALGGSLVLGSVDGAGNPAAGTDSTVVGGGSGDPDNPQRGGGGGRGEPAPTFALTITAPAGAAISVNGSPVGRELWSADTLAAGQYTLIAQLPVGGACSWGRDSIVVRAIPGRSQDVELQPRHCGALVLPVTNNDKVIPSRFQITTASGETVVEGDVPVVGEIVLPAGTHTLTVTAERCALFRDQIRITRDSVTNRPVPLICSRS